jgi:predicted CXXCH cytochrome family protein
VRTSRGRSRVAGQVRRWSEALLPAAFLAVGMSVSAGAAEAPPKEIKPDAPCATAACHADILKLKNLHAPAASNECTACHNPKGNLHQFTLAAKGPELCASCHGPLGKKKAFHKPVGEDCTTCHSPHGGETKALLVSAVPDLCTTCHGPSADEIAKGKSSHSIALEGKACLACHNPHTSDFEKLLLAKPMALCLGCHNQAIALKGRTIPSIKDEITGAKSVHGPVKDEDCLACHRPHASAQTALLAAAYPPQFYAPFTPDAYALCFQCHDQALAVALQTKDATSFRNGTKNLHAAHVNDKVKGRTCRACHAPHGSSLPHLIRASVPFGPSGWLLPIRFQETKTGGSCAPGCHVPRAYDRETPVKE